MRIYLETERLFLRRLTAADVDHLYELHNDPDVMRYLNGGKHTPRHVIENQTLPKMLRHYGRSPHFGFWAAIEKYTGEFVGWFEFRPPQPDDPEVVELGYRLRKSSWGKGYATEGSRALVHKGFTELGVRRVVAETMVVNTGSQRVLVKAGLSHMRTFHTSWEEPIPGTEHGEVEYALDKADWERQRDFL